MVDRQNREKAAFGGGGIANADLTQRQRRERLRQLALETFDITKDPYLKKNPMGTMECRLCGTVHATEGSYMSHSQGRRHQTALTQRVERDAKLRARQSGVVLTTTSSLKPKKTLKKGRPGYRVVKFIDAETGNKGLQFTLSFPDIEADLQPRQCFMSAYEQRVEKPDPQYQYLLFAAAPYETIGFKIPNNPIDKANFLTSWNKENKTFTLRLLYKQMNTTTNNNNNTADV